MMSDVMAKKATLSVQNKWVVGKINRAWLNHGEILVIGAKFNVPNSLGARFADSLILSLL